MQHIIMRESVDTIMFMHVSDCSKTQKIGHKTVEKDSKMLKLAPGDFKTQEMSVKAVKKLLFAIIHAPDHHKIFKKSYFKKF